MILLVIALGHFIATAQGHYSLVTLLSSGCEDCLILLIHFRFKCKHKTFIRKPTEPPRASFLSVFTVRSVRSPPCRPTALSVHLLISCEVLHSCTEDTFIVRSKLIVHKH